MIALALLALSAAPAALGAACPQAAPDLRLAFPQAGMVSFWTSRVTRGGGGHAAPVDRLIACNDGRGEKGGKGGERHRLLVAARETNDFAGRPSLVAYQVPEWPSPVVVMVASYVRGDGVTLRPVVVAEDGGGLKEILAPLALDAADALCLGRPAPRSSAAALTLRFTVGNECFLCFPKAFAATEYRWQQGKLTGGSAITTKKRYARWQEALAELGLACPIEVAHGEAPGAPR